MEWLDVTYTVLGIVEDAFEYTHCGGTVEAAHIGPSFVEPFDCEGNHYSLRGKASSFQLKPASTSAMGMPLPPAKIACPS